MDRIKRHASNIWTHQDKFRIVQLWLKDAPPVGVDIVPSMLMAYMSKTGLIEKPRLVSGLIDCFGKQGCPIPLIRQLFDEMKWEDQSGVCNVMLKHYFYLDGSEKGFEFLEEIRRRNIKFDRYTFTSALRGCCESKSMTLGEAISVFHKMINDYFIEPDMVHYGILVEIICLKGNAMDAYKVALALPKQDRLIWRALIHRCSGLMNVEVGDLAIQALKKMGSLSSDEYVLISNFMRMRGKYQESEKLQQEMKEEGLEISPDYAGSKVMNNGLNAIRFSYSKILAATDKFSYANLLKETGLVFKGQVKDTGQLIAVKAVKVSSPNELEESLHCEAYAISRALHENIVTLYGYCCNENFNILVYEYICNRSLEWHLFDNTDHILEWNRRLDIAIGIAQGLHYLHEECPRGPIIHLNVRPSKILLTRDFVPKLGDCGLPLWKITNEIGERTWIIDNMGYLAPEYIDKGIVSLKTDVYAFGIVLLQLISGQQEKKFPRGAFVQWARALLQRSAFHELIDPRLTVPYRVDELLLFVVGDRQLRRMVRAASVCVQKDPRMRPSMRQVLHILKGNFSHEFGRILLGRHI